MAVDVFLLLMASANSSCLWLLMESSVAVNGNCLWLLMESVCGC